MIIMIMADSDVAHGLRLDANSGKLRGDALLEKAALLVLGFARQRAVEARVPQQVAVAVADEVAAGREGLLLARIKACIGESAKIADIETQLNRLRSPFRTAEAFWVEEMIDPRETRPLLCDFANLAAKLRRPGQVAFGMRP